MHIVIGYTLKVMGAATILASGAVLVTKVLIDTGVIVP